MMSRYDIDNTVITQGKKGCFNFSRINEIDGLCMIYQLLSIFYDFIVLNVINLIIRHYSGNKVPK